MTKRIPVRQDPDRLSTPATRALNAVIGGGFLMVEFTSDERAVNGRRIFATPTGRRVADADFDELVAKRRIVAREDGLIPGASQSWVPA